MDKLNLQYVTRKDMHSMKNMLGHAFFVTLYGFFKYAPFPFFNYFRFLILRIFWARVSSTYIMDGVTIWFPWRVAIGKCSSLNQGVIVDGTGGVTIGEGVRIAAYCTLNTADHDFADSQKKIVDQGFVVAPIIIEDDVWIGTGTSINKGVTIGKGAVIGSGSVVTKNIPPYSVAVGVPCKVIRSRCDVASV
ncbi:acyltransferase [Candidatus Parcubacteria bacterium]|jgi:acetyltransferase-like isoleucine patch superfamily enzyme|nr:MAG: acyltransferase [Candidatus Parcubacteria bacterium]